MTMQGEIWNEDDMASELEEVIEAWPCCPGRTEACERPWFMLYFLRSL